MKEKDELVKNGRFDDSKTQQYRKNMDFKFEGERKSTSLLSPTPFLTGVQPKSRPTR
jgi:hypothetical protein